MVVWQFSMWIFICKFYRKSGFFPIFISIFHKSAQKSKQKSAIGLCTATADMLTVDWVYWVFVVWLAIVLLSQLISVYLAVLLFVQNLMLRGSNVHHVIVDLELFHLPVYFKIQESSKDRTRSPFCQSLTPKLSHLHFVQIPFAVFVPSIQPW